jgi:hypothetical protein
MVSQFQLKDWIIFEGYKPHLESIEAIIQSDLLLLINPRLEQDEAIVPGKIFEYIATGNPILSISSKGSENEMILKETQIGANYDWNDIQGIKNYIYNCIMHPKKNTAEKNNNYSRAEQYQKLIQIL